MALNKAELQAILNNPDSSDSQRNRAKSLLSELENPARHVSNDMGSINRMLAKIRQEHRQRIIDRIAACPDGVGAEKDKQYLRDLDYR